MGENGGGDVGSDVDDDNVLLRVGSVVQSARSVSSLDNDRCEGEWGHGKGGEAREVQRQEREKI